MWYSSKQRLYFAIGLTIAALVQFYRQEFGSGCAFLVAAALFGWSYWATK